MYALIGIAGFITLILAIAVLASLHDPSPAEDYLDVCDALDNNTYDRDVADAARRLIAAGYSGIWLRFLANPDNLDANKDYLLDTVRKLKRFEEKGETK